MALRLFKRADDLSSESSFEEAFASLAFAVQNDAIPRLAKHILGFQLLEKSEDERRAVGIIGLQLGSILAYAPFFFHDGEMSGNELLWLVKSDTFVPKTDEWIDYLLGLGTRSLGKPITYEVARRNVGVPDLSPFREPNVKTSAKYASWVRPGLGGIYAAADPADDPLYKGTDLRSVVRDPYLAASLINIIDQHPRVAAYVSRFYGRGLLKQARSIAKQTTSVFAHLHTSSVPWVIPPVERTDLRIYTNIDNDDGTLTPKERMQLLKHGYYIKDKRKAFSKAAEYEHVKEEVARYLVTPTQTGIYDVLRNDGSFARCLVIDGRYYLYPADKPTEVVRTDDPLLGRNSSQMRSSILGQPVNISNEVVYETAMPIVDAVRASERFDDYPAESRTYDVDLLVGDRYGTWLELCVKISGNIERKDEWEIETSWCNNSGSTIAVAFGGEDTDKISILPSLIVLPPTVRAFPLRFKRDRRHSALGNIVSNFLFTDKVITPKAADEPGSKAASVLPYCRLQLLSNDVDVFINGRQMPKKAALFSLVRDHGFKESDAIRLIKSAYKKRKTYLVKYAQVIGTAPPMPFPPDPAPTINPLFGVPAVTEQVQTVTPGSAHLSAQMPPPDAPLNNQVDPQIIAAVTQAARTGQKEVFDTSIMSAMLSTTNVFDIVEKHISKLIKGVDAIGRLLFNIYWHKEAFESRLGRYDIAKIRDTLRSVFTQLGNAAVSLKERASAGSGQDIGEMMEQQEEERL